MLMKYVDDMLEPCDNSQTRIYNDILNALSGMCEGHYVPRMASGHPHPVSSPVRVLGAL